MMRSASGTYSLPSACMKSYWVSTSQKMTRAMAGNLSEDVGGCQQARRTDAQTHRRTDAQGKTEGSQRDYLFTHTVHRGASMRLAVALPKASAPPLLRHSSSAVDSVRNPPTP